MSGLLFPEIISLRHVHRLIARLKERRVGLVESSNKIKPIKLQHIINHT